MREKYLLLQDRIELLGPIRHEDVLSVRFDFVSFFRLKLDIFL
jgi:phosphatidylinositol N-acetylglucosaminyltransferase subunit A